jgi:uncharacterized protein (DUF4213/DUF364 family)
MPRRDTLYELLLDYANLHIEVEQVLVGLNWTLCNAGGVGLAATPGGGRWRHELDIPLAGRPLAELSLWLRNWDRQQAAIGLAAVNAAVNSEADMVYHEGALFQGRQALDTALEWFRPKLQGHKVALLGANNPFGRFQAHLELSHLPSRDGALHPACEVMLGKAEWLFIDGQHVADKTLPRALELASNAQVVLYGPQVPWLEEWRDFGIDYLLGSQLEHPSSLYRIIAEGGGLHNLQQGISYRVCDLHSQSRPSSEAMVSRSAMRLSH